MKKTKLISAAAGIALVGMTALGANAANVVITALASDGSPLVGATVNQYTSGWSYAGVTDINGQLIIVGISGNRRFSVTYNGTSATTATITGIPTGNDPYNSVPTFYTTKVTVNGKDELGNAVSGVAVTYYTSGWVSFGSTDGSGSVSKELFAGSRNFNCVYNHTGNPQTVLVDGDGFTAGQSTTLNSYLTRVNFKATSYMSANVQGVGITFYSGAWYGLPSTDANGESSYLMYPGSYTQFRASINSTSTGDFTVTVPGDGLTSSQSITRPLNPTRVKFNNANLPKYYSNAWYTINGANYYMFPGTYKLTFGSYSRNVAISGLNFDKAASVLVLKDHSGALLDIDRARGGSPSISYWVDGPTSASMESPGVWIDIANYNGNNNRTFEVTKNTSTSTQSKDISVNNVFNFQTNLMTLQLQTCSAAPLSGASIRFGFGSTITSHWNQYAPTDFTDANGQASNEFFPGNFIVEMNINQSKEAKNITLVGNDMFTWTTTLVKLHYPGQIAYGGAGVNAYFSATKEAEMLPGTVNFSFRTSGENIVPITVPSTGCVYELTPVIGRLVNSSNTPLMGGTFSSYQGVWNTADGATKANGNVVALLTGNPATATVAMSYLGGRQQKNYVNLASVANIIPFQTVHTTMTLVDADNNSIDGDGLQFYASGWQTFGTGVTSGGSASMELLAGSASYSFAMSLNGTRQQMSFVDVAATPTLAFQAAKVRVHYVGADCNPVAGASASYYAASSWRSMGTTDATGYSSEIDMLPPAGYSFRAGTAPQQNGIAITGGYQTVEFSQCININVRKINAPVAAGTFRLYPNPATSELHIEVVADNSEVAIYSLDGRLIQSHTYNSGASTIRVADFANGMYILKMHNGDNVETYRFTKQ